MEIQRVPDVQAERPIHNRLARSPERSTVLHDGRSDTVRYHTDQVEIFQRRLGDRERKNKDRVGPPHTRLLRDRFRHCERVRERGVAVLNAPNDSFDTTHWSARNASTARFASFWKLASIPLMSSAMANTSPVAEHADDETAETPLKIAQAHEQHRRSVTGRRPRWLHVRDGRGPTARASVVVVGPDPACPTAVANPGARPKS